MQNSYTKEGQLSWWLALLECLWIHKGRVRIPFPSKLKSILIFTQSPPSPPNLRAHELGHGPQVYQGPGPAGPLTSQRAQWPAPGWAMGLTPPGRLARPGQSETLTIQQHLLYHNVSSTPLIQTYVRIRTRYQQLECDFDQNTFKL